MKMRYNFDSFNARHTPEDMVAETFIDNGHYSRLCGLNHTLLLGPRGCGKTTLLKMLTVPARNKWSKLKPESPLPEIAFTSIYIPMDVHFQDQLSQIEHTLETPDPVLEVMSRAAMTISAQQSTIECFLDRIVCEGRNDPVKESNLAVSLIDNWRLTDDVPSLAVVRLLLSARLLQLGELVGALRITPATSLTLPEWIHLDLLTSLNFACDAFDTAFELNTKSRWALCFDELELAPAWLVVTLFSDLRSSFPRLLFKLGTSPNPSKLGAGTGSALNDFDPIKLWAPPPKQRREFCSALACQVIANRLREDVTPEQLLGESDWSGDDEDALTGTEAPKRYERGSEEWQVLRDEAGEDRTLRSYLVLKEIDPDDPSPPAGQLRDTVLRKIKPLVFFRRSFSKFDSVKKKRVRKPRKLRTEFFGVPAVFDISDGNPRFLKRIFEEMCAEARSPAESHETVERNMQSRILNLISLQFHNYVRGIPGSQATIDGNDTYLFSMLHSIGKFFSSKILLGDFSADPVSSFVVNAQLPPELLRLLELAAEHAAIIRLDPEETPYDPNLINRRFRLTYLLAPLCQLPLRSYGAVSLEKCLITYRPLKHLAQKAKKKPAKPKEDPDLFES